MYAEVLKVEPDNPGANAGLARYYMATGQSEQAREQIDALPPEVAQQAEISAVRAALELAKDANATSGQLPELQAKVAGNPDDHQARFDLALALYAANQTEQAIDELLILVQRDRMWNDEAARKQLLKIFEALGFADPTTVDARRRLSSLLFS